MWFQWKEGGGEAELITPPGSKAPIKPWFGSTPPTPRSPSSSDVALASADLLSESWLSTPGLQAEPTRARVPHHALQSNKYCFTLKPCDCGANTSLCLDTPDRNYTNATADHPKLQSPHKTNLNRG